MVTIQPKLFNSNVPPPQKSSARKKYLKDNEQALTDLISALAIAQPSDPITFIHNWASAILNNRPKGVKPEPTDRATHGRPNLDHFTNGFNKGSKTDSELFGLSDIAGTPRQFLSDVQKSGFNSERDTSVDRNARLKASAFKEGGGGLYGSEVDRG